MRQRGRKGVASLSVVVPIGTAPRIEPPASLSAPERDLWLTVVNAKPADWFTPAQAALLELYVRHVTAAGAINALLAQIEVTASMPEYALDHYARLLKLRDREARAASSLATRLRLTNQSVSKFTAGRKDAAFVPEAKKPWQS